ncbi:hypothetical protein EVG20_g3651 [Dentipellis fragilis]|uniref:Uncharacterized protein n=1 Tax=Dentipellis fragilis TaxID=205917 RepID=A0A4Y9Z2R4_9AGAM|nr:hypothetical protein EVG20_g3651 [Dentipellis fragilis]
MIPSPTSRMKPPELKYGWRIGEKKLRALIESHFADAIQYSMFPELDDDGNEPEMPPEEFIRMYPDTNATIFSQALVDSILKHLDIPITKTSRLTVSVDYLCDSQAPRYWSDGGFHLDWEGYGRTSLLQDQSACLTQ